MLSTLLFSAALLFTLAAAALHDRAASWRLRPLLHLVGPAAALAALALAPSWAIVEKLLTALALPAGLLWLAVFFVAWWLLLRRQRRPAALALAGWCALSLAGNVWIGQLMHAWLEADYPPVPSSAPFDAVLVLGGGTDLTPWGTPQLSHAGERLRVAADLYRRALTPLLVTSGSSIPDLTQSDERDLAHETAALWQAMGVPPAAIVQVPGPRNTSQEIAALAALVRARGWRRIGLVTSASHLRRAMRLASRHGLHPTPIPADAAGQLQPPSIPALIPSGPGFLAVHIASKELLASLLGR